VPVAPEVDVFEGEVGGNGDLFSGFGLEEGAIVANSETQGRASGLFPGAEGGDQREFSAEVRGFYRVRWSSFCVRYQNLLLF
jgi:hypothetical protein